jgi:hypothetical protein
MLNIFLYLEDNNFTCFIYDLQEINHKTSSRLIANSNSEFSSKRNGRYVEYDGLTIDFRTSRFSFTGNPFAVLNVLNACLASFRIFAISSMPTRITFYVYSHILKTQCLKNEEELKKPSGNDGLTGSQNHFRFNIA